MEKFGKIYPRHNKEPFNTIKLRVDLENYPEAEFLGEVSAHVPIEHARTTYTTNVVDEKYWY